MLIKGVDFFGWPGDVKLAQSRQYGLDHVFAQHEHSCQDANAVGEGAVTSAVFDALDQRLAAQFGKIVAGDQN